MNDINTDAPADGGGGNPTGGEPAAWLSSVPENLRTHEAFNGVESASEVYQQFVDMKVNSENMIKIPGEDATDEDRAAFLSKLGRPESADDYTIAKPDGLPDGMPYDEAVEQHFKGVFHEIGLNDDGAKKLWSAYHELAAKGYADNQQAEKDATEAAINTLKDEWKGDKFKENTELAHRAFTNILDSPDLQKEAKAFLEDTKIGGVPLGNHPMFLKIFHQIGVSISDDRLGTGGNGVSAQMSEEEKAAKRFPNTKFKN